MRKLYFDAPDGTIFVKVIGKSIIITIETLGIQNLPIEKIIYNDKMMDRERMEMEYPDLKGLPLRVLFHKCRLRWKKLINELGTEEKIVSYVISDLEGKHGFKYVGGE